MPVPDLVETSGDLDFDPKRGRLDINLLSDGAGFGSFSLFSPLFQVKVAGLSPPLQKFTSFFFYLEMYLSFPPKVSRSQWRAGFASLLFDVINRVDKWTRTPHFLFYLSARGIFLCVNAFRFISVCRPLWPVSTGSAISLCHCFSLSEIGEEPRNHFLYYSGSTWPQQFVRGEGLVWWPEGGVFSKVHKCHHCS